MAKYYVMHIRAKDEEIFEIFDTESEAQACVQLTSCLDGYLEIQEI